MSSASLRAIARIERICMLSSSRWTHTSDLDKDFFQRGLARVKGAHLALCHPLCQSPLVNEIVKAQNLLIERAVAILPMLALLQRHQERSLSMGQLQVARCIVGNESPIDDKSHPLAELVGLIHQACGQQDGHPFLAASLHRLTYL